MTVLLQARETPPTSRQPNDLDRRRIERALERRGRYRYVRPRVLDAQGGYRIESPCCSRNIDRAGGVIDIALIEYVGPDNLWRLYRKDHAAREWRLYDIYDRLAELLQQLGADPERAFWQ